MFDRFTRDARRVITLAQEESRRRNDPHIGTEHLLLGLSRTRACSTPWTTRGWTPS